MWKKIIDVKTVLALYLLQMDDHYKAKEMIDPIIESAVQKGYSERLSQIYTVIGAFHVWAKEDFHRGLEHLGRALRLADEVGDVVSMLFANFNLAYALASDCRFQEAFAHIEKALEINLAANSLWGVSVIKSFQSWFQVLHGQVGLGYRTGNEAAKQAEQSSDIYSRTWAHTSRGVSCYGRGALEEAIENLSRGVDLGESINHPAFLSIAHFFLAETYLEIEEYEVAKPHYRRSIEVLDA